MNQFCVHVDSRKTSTFPENQPYSFKTRLPSSLSLRGNWKCAVASATFRNDLEIDEYMDLTFSIEWQDVDENIDFITLNDIKGQKKEVDNTFRSIIYKFFIFLKASPLDQSKNFLLSPPYPLVMLRAILVLLALQEKKIQLELITIYV